MSDKTKVGVIGCGHISDSYFRINKQFAFFDVVACADLVMDHAREKAQKWNVPKACSAKELLADEEVQCVINLTVPQAHGEVMLQCISAGKSVYTEKPFAVTRDEARQTIEAAALKGLRVGSAPDTFMGGGHQTVRKLIDDGAIGDVVGATAFMVCRGHEHWHPSPQFYYQLGGGPMFDMGPYYLTDLVQLLGPITGVMGMARTSFDKRTISSNPLAGTVIDVEVPTHVAGTFQFAGGAIGTMIMSFDVCGHRLPKLEIYGSEGSIYVPDPNRFGGPVMLLQRGQSEAVEVPLTHGYAENSRGIGMADMIMAMQSGRDHRCNERLAYHVLDVMQAFHDSGDTGRRIDIQSTCQRPAMLPVGLKDGQLDS